MEKIIIITGFILIQLPTWKGYSEHERNHYEYGMRLFPEVELTFSQKLARAIKHEQRIR